MMWTNLTFYKDKYLMGDTAAQVVPDVSFARMAARAEKAVNWKNVAFEDGFIAPQYLQECICETAELLFIASESTADKATGVTSSAWC